MEGCPWSFCKLRRYTGERHDLIKSKTYCYKKSPNLSSYLALSTICGKDTFRMMLIIVNYCKEKTMKESISMTNWDKRTVQRIRLLIYRFRQQAPSKQKLTLNTFIAFSARMKIASVALQPLARKDVCAELRKCHSCILLLQRRAQRKSFNLWSCTARWWQCGSLYHDD